MKILVSGGHLTPALAFIDKTKEIDPNISFIFVGREYSQDRLQQKAQERSQVEERGIHFIPLITARSPQHLGELVASVFVFISAILMSLFILIWHRPQIFVSFGGYVALPVAIASWLLSIPIITHEQTRYPGTANRCIAYLSQYVAVSFEETRTSFPEHKTVLTGNPLRSVLFQKAPPPAWATHMPKNKPLLLVTGGNQGSYVLNTVIEQCLDSLTRDWNVIHACGNKTSTTNYLKVLEKAKAKLRPSQRDSYIVKEWFTASELAWIYHSPVSLISRSGANTILEAVAFQIPGIFIPLPNSKFDEQLHNAKMITDAQGGILLPQKELNPESLLDTTLTLRKQYKAFKKALSGIKQPLDSAEKLVALTKKTLSEY